MCVCVFVGCVSILFFCVCDGKEVLVIEESHEQGATSREVFPNFQMEAFGFPDGHRRRSRVQDCLCRRSCCSCLHPLLLLPLLWLSHLIFIFFHRFKCSFFLGSCCVLSWFWFLGRDYNNYFFSFSVLAFVVIVGDTM